MLVDAGLQERVRLAALGADVGAALTQEETLSDMLRRCTEAVVQHLDAAFARIWTLQMPENVLHSRPALACTRTSTVGTAAYQWGSSKLAASPRSASPI